ncbi:MAG TPA: RDD family protein [Acidimicrobiales bacterium]
MTRTRVVHREGAQASRTYTGLPGGSLGVRVKALMLTFLLIVVTLGVGWMAWSVLEWRHGRTVSFKLMGLRVVRASDGRPIGLGTSLLRNALLCSVLFVPTMLVCIVLALAFVMGASPPEDLLSKPRKAPWDRLTKTMVVQERRRSFSRGRYAQLSEWPPANEPVSMN